MAMTQAEVDRRAAAIFGDYVVPPLDGVKGVIEFLGPHIRCHMQIMGSNVKLVRGEAKTPDTVVASDVEEELVKLVEGKCNPVTALLQGHIDAKGDLLLLTKVAGSMPEIRKQAQARAGEGGAP